MLTYAKPPTYSVGRSSSKKPTRTRTVGTPLSHRILWPVISTVMATGRTSSADIGHLVATMVGHARSVGPFGHQSHCIKVFSFPLSSRMVVPGRMVSSDKSFIFLPRVDASVRTTRTIEHETLYRLKCPTGRQRPKRPGLTTARSGGLLECQTAMGPSAILSTSFHAAQSVPDAV